MDLIKQTIKGKRQNDCGLPLQLIYEKNNF